MVRRKSRGYTFVDVVEQVADIIFKLGGFLLVVCVGYLTFGLFTGGLSGTASLPAADRLRVAHNVETACHLVGFLGLLFTFAVVVKFRFEDVTGYVLAISGFVLFFGVQALPVVTDFIPGKVRPEYFIKGASEPVISQLRILGLTFLLPGVFFCILDLIDKVRGLWSRKPTGKAIWGEETTRQKHPIYGSCWDMVFCREFIRDFCPAYEASKPCWKLKCGCYCDEKTILQALKYQGGKSGEFGGEVAFNLGMPQKKELTAAQKRERCRNCMLYMEHQRQKYQLVTPFVMLGVGLTMWQIYPLLQGHFATFIKATDEFVRKISFTAHNAAMHEPSPIAFTGDGTNTVFLLFVAWLSIVVLSYALRVLEYCVFKLKI